MANKNKFDMLILWIMIIGSINWLFVAFGGNLVETLLGWIPNMPTITYAIVGFAGIMATVRQFMK